MQSTPRTSRSCPAVSLDSKNSFANAAQHDVSTGKLTLVLMNVF